MTVSRFNFKKEVIVLTLIWIICSVMIYKVFPSSPYQGQSVIIFYGNIISSAFFPALFLFFIYLSLYSLLESVFYFFKGKKEIPEINNEQAD